MRTIKFRAWHKTTHWLRPVAGISLADGFVSVYMEKDSPMRGPYLTVSFDEVELMQFTGLVDRYGKEIFEGDIVNLVLGKHILEVRWGVFSFQFWEIATQTQKLVYAADLKRLEVIGTIYETPELLEVNHAQS